MLPLILAPLAQIAENIVVGVAVDRLAKFRKDTDWTQVKIAADTKVRAVLPNAAVDDIVIRAVNEAVDKVQSALGETAEAEKVLTMLAAGDFAGAARELMAHVTAGSKAA